MLMVFDADVNGVVRNMMAMGDDDGDHDAMMIMTTMMIMMIMVVVLSMVMAVATVIKLLHSCASTIS